MQKTTRSPVQLLTVEADYEGQRIDNFLITRLKSVPKTRVYRIVRKGEVRVNKKRVQASYRLQAGDIIRIPPLDLDVPVALPTPHQRTVDTLKSRILFEDKNLLIINKPSGLAVHGGSGIRLGVVEILRTMYPKSPHLELAHRLDADTSGCLILAKKRSILKELHDLFREKEHVHKIYWALTMGIWKPTEFKVSAPLRKNIMQGGERIVRVDPEGKESLTIFRPLEVFNHATLVEATLYTGRTHQIRVHTQYKNHPIAGDEKYGDRYFNKKMRENELKRLFLHAYSIEFTLASIGQTVSVQAPLDEDLVKCLESLRRSEKS